MTKLGTITFTGDSGNDYTFDVYPWDTAFEKGFGAIYFITKRTKKQNKKYSHARIYVGQTGDLSTRFDNHHKQACFDKNNKNCICIYEESNEQSRRKIEVDLINKYNPPCNES